MEPRYSVDMNTVIEKLKSRIADEAYYRALSESAVDQLLIENQGLQTELARERQSRLELEQNTAREIEELKAELEDLSGKPTYEYQVVESPE